MDHHIIRNLDRADLGHAAEIVSSEVDQHVMLGKLLLVGEQFPLERPVLFLRLSARTGTGDRKGSQAAVLKAYKRFRRGAHDLVPVNGKEHHVRRGIGGAEHAIRGEQAVCIRARELPRLNRLKDIAIEDIFARLFHDVRVLLFRYVAGELRLCRDPERRQRRLISDERRHCFE